MSTRLPQIDLLRGSAVLFMIIVNSSGSSSYPFLLHAEWTGWTAADIVFPIFLFLVGVVIPFGVRDRNWWHIIRRTTIFLILGLFLNFITASLSLSDMRIPGVLQRLGVCFFGVSTIHLTIFTAGLCDQRIITHIIILTSFCLAYILLVYLIPSQCFDRVSPFYPPNCTAESLFDIALFGPHHIHTKDYDPEGAISTLTATATTYAGYVTGVYLKSIPITQGSSDHVITRLLLIATTVLLPVGYLMSYSYQFRNPYTPLLLSFSQSRRR